MFERDNDVVLKFGVLIVLVLFGFFWIKLLAEYLRKLTGLIAGASAGLLRVTRVDEDLVGDIIPVDFSTNLMIAAGWHTAVTK